MEDITSYGRIDFTLKYKDFIYITELKVEKSGEEAFKQIKSKKYEEKYLSENKTIFLIGINFSEELKNVENYDFEEIKK
ncbi:MAG: PD-(D/E)XK nuclease domain-containing protein [Candidatus Gracilibacteria bacterium]|nr:PD-(D/E)XK nuclease domain-containing protein [Candidatus Gracilibacteria bacterium]